MTIATAIAPGVQALIMAGGRGERLYPLTASRPIGSAQIRAYDFRDEAKNLPCEVH